MIETTLHELAAAGVIETPGVLVADAGYWKNDASDAIVTQGIAVLVAPDERPAERHGRRTLTSSALSRGPRTEPSNTSPIPRT
ncbi:hypothetical protein [Capillimicrobium parvum]|uniref:Transposase n=1 Tax=Capillimicrobium parvum TaxID=2884022 RepID=A0A9E7C080_9ACTN|nr:hypothetical protein [Capillimicrobium parvum]UGS36091.1 hypothetical protein DSM104329_02489 [Capillimicrobium parvum]